MSPRLNDREERAVTHPDAHFEISDAALALIRQPFTSAVDEGRLDIQRIAPDVVCITTLEGDRGVSFGIEGGQYHVVNEIGEVVTIGPLDVVINRAVERFRIL